MTNKNEEVSSNSNGASNNDMGEIDIVINNVVSTFFTRCHLNLKQICMKGMNVIYNQENKVVSMKLKKPSITASIWSSGKITCAGANSEEESLIASRKVARCLQRIGFETKFARFKIVNVLGTVHLPFDILLHEFSAAHPKSASYEPELHPGVTFKLDNPKASLKVFHTGSITIAASSAAKVKEAMEIVYPLVYEHRLVRTQSPVYNATTSVISPVSSSSSSATSSLMLNQNLSTVSANTFPFIKNPIVLTNASQLLFSNSSVIQNQKVISENTQATPVNIITIPQINNLKIPAQNQSLLLGLKRNAAPLVQQRIKKYKSTPNGLVLIDE